MLAFSTQVRGFKPGRSRQNFKGEKILNTPSFGGEVKPSVPCRRFAACKKLRRHVVKITIVPPFAARISRVFEDVGGTWRQKWERLNAGESNGELPLRTCQGCSVSEPYQSPDWALVPAKPAEYPLLLLLLLLFYRYLDR